jgi:cytochrome oxidase Cu insertion factor (SCO1/SenC/PrrC family)
MRDVNSRKPKHIFARRNQLIVLLLIIGSAFIILIVFPPDLFSINPNTSTASGDFKTVPLKDLDGKTVQINDFEGKVVVLEFMTTWCLTCAQMDSVLNELNSKYQSDNVVLLSVTTDPAYDTSDVLKNHIAKKEISWTVVRDTTLMLTNYFQVVELSTILIISPDGEVVNVFTGFTELDKLSRAVDQLQ